MTSCIIGGGGAWSPPRASPLSWRAADEIQLHVNATSCPGVEQIATVQTVARASIIDKTERQEPVLDATTGGNRLKRRITTLIAVLAIGAVLPTIPIGAPVAAAGLGSQTFFYTGSLQGFTVPTGVAEVMIEAWGAQGGTSGLGDMGGRGGYVRGFLTVTPGETLRVSVGGQGGSGASGGAGGWNGGGSRGGGTWTVPSGGGGASDVRRSGTGLFNRVLVAGGGGGTAGTFGGDGAYHTGTDAADNGYDSPQQGAQGGRGGSHVGGGGGGGGFCGNGHNGTLGAGGNGGATNGYAGAGGGGGYFGGGAGGSGCNWGGAGGGGGSSWVSGAITGAIHEAGVGWGYGRVTIAWTPDSMAANIAATETMPDGVNNTGDSPVPVTAGVVDQGYTPLDQADKLADEAALEERMPYNLAHYLTPETERRIVLPPGTCLPGIVVGPRSASCPPATEPAEPDPASAQTTLRLHQQQTSYTCGAATARTVIDSMTSNDYPEEQLANEIGISPATGVRDYRKLTATLNRYQSRDRFMGDPDPAMSPTRLMAIVVNDVRYRNHPAVLNLNQSVLPYWNRSFDPNDKHYNVAYGYNLRGGGFINIGDVAPGRPYGTHTVSLEITTRAVKANKGLVIR